MKRLEFRTVVDWEKHRKMNGVSKSAWQEVVFREHGAPAQAIQSLVHQGKPATLDAILTYCEQYDRQEHLDCPLSFVEEEYVRDRVIIALGRMIEAGMVWSALVDVSE